MTSPRSHTSPIWRPTSQHDIDPSDIQAMTSRNRQFDQDMRAIEGEIESDENSTQISSSQHEGRHRSSSSQPAAATRPKRSKSRPSPQPDDNEVNSTQAWIEQQLTQSQSQTDQVLRSEIAQRHRLEHGRQQGEETQMHIDQLVEDCQLLHRVDQEFDAEIAPMQQQLTDSFQAHDAWDQSLATELPPLRRSAEEQPPNHHVTQMQFNTSGTGPLAPEDEFDQECDAVEQHNLAGQRHLYKQWMKLQCVRSQRAKKDAELARLDAQLESIRANEKTRQYLHEATLLDYYKTRCANRHRLYELSEQLRRKHELPSQPEPAQPAMNSAEDMTQLRLPDDVTPESIAKVHLARNKEHKRLVTETTKLQAQKEVYRSKIEQHKAKQQDEAKKISALAGCRNETFDQARAFCREMDAEIAALDQELEQVALKQAELDAAEPSRRQQCDEHTSIARQTEERNAQTQQELEATQAQIDSSREAIQKHQLELDDSRDSVNQRSAAVVDKVVEFNSQLHAPQVQESVAELRQMHTQLRADGQQANLMANPDLRLAVDAIARIDDQTRQGAREIQRLQLDHFAAKRRLAHISQRREYAMADRETVLEGAQKLNSLVQAKASQLDAALSQHLASERQEVVSPALADKQQVSSMCRSALIEVASKVQSRAQDATQRTALDAPRNRIQSSTASASSSAQGVSRLDHLMAASDARLEDINSRFNALQLKVQSLSPEEQQVFRAEEQKIMETVYNAQTLAQAHIIRPALAAVHPNIDQSASEAKHQHQDRDTGMIDISDEERPSQPKKGKQKSGAKSKNGKKAGTKEKSKSNSRRR